MPRARVLSARHRLDRDRGNELEEVNRIKKKVAELESIMRVAFERSKQPRRVASRGNRGQQPPGQESKSSKSQQQQQQQQHRQKPALPPEVEREVELPMILLSRRTVSAAAELGRSSPNVDTRTWPRSIPRQQTHFGLKPGALSWSSCVCVSVCGVATGVARCRHRWE